MLVNPIQYILRIFLACWLAYHKVVARKSQNPEEARIEPTVFSVTFFLREVSSSEGLGRSRDAFDGERLLLQYIRANCAGGAPSR